MEWLAAGFFITALLYASVGFGGGSTYSALMGLTGVNFRLIPVISPICNIIVVTGGTLRYHRAGLLPWRRMLPLVLVSTPLALLGGLTPIKEPAFMTILAIGLALSGIALLLQSPAAQSLSGQSPSEGIGNALESGDRRFGQDILVSALIGYVAGLVGLGGGIFLAPYLHMTRWAQPKQVAAASSAFILVNSIAGLIGQLLKLNASGGMPDISSYWPLALAVFAGGQIGSITGIRILAPIVVRRATAVLILYVAGQLIWKLLYK